MCFVVLQFTQPRLHLCTYTYSKTTFYTQIYIYITHTYIYICIYTLQYMIHIRSSAFFSGTQYLVPYRGASLRWIPVPTRRRTAEAVWSTTTRRSCRPSTSRDGTTSRPRARASVESTAEEGQSLVEQQACAAAWATCAGEVEWDCRLEMHWPIEVNG